MYRDRVVLEEERDRAAEGERGWGTTAGEEVGMAKTPKSSQKWSDPDLFSQRHSRPPRQAFLAAVVVKYPADQ
jgi:hypothetical protein